MLTPSRAPLIQHEQRLPRILKLVLVSSAPWGTLMSFSPTSSLTSSHCTLTCLKFQVSSISGSTYKAVHISPDIDCQESAACMVSDVLRSKACTAGQR